MDIQELQEVCRQVRRDIIIMTNKAGAGHPADRCPQRKRSLRCILTS